MWERESKGEKKEIWRSSDSKQGETVVVLERQPEDRENRERLMAICSALLEKN